MVMIMFFSVIVLVYILYDIIPIFAKKEWNVIITDFILLVCAYTLWILLALDVNIPSISKIVGNFVDSIMK